MTAPTISTPVPPAARQLLAWFIAWQLVLIAGLANGPSGDEGIYAWLGMVEWARWPHVEGIDWVNGSPVGWPLVAGALWRWGGLEALRLGALALMASALWCSSRAAQVVAGDRAATVTMLLLVSSGPVMALGHLGVYDVPALSAIALAVLSAALHGRDGRLRWAVSAGLAAGVAVAVKYALVFAAVPVLLMLYSRNWRHMALSYLIAGCFVASHNVLVLGSMVPPSYWAYEAAAAPVGRWLVAAEQLFLAGVPTVLFVLGLRFRRTIATASVKWAAAGALAVFPVFHLLTGNPQSANKHVVIALVVAAPVLGAMWADVRRRTLGSLLLVWGVVQWGALEYSWVDAREVVGRLEREVAAGDVVLSNEGTFRYRAALYARGLDAGLKDLDVRSPLPAGGAVWVVLESPVREDERTWLDAAGLREVGRWRGRHVGADARRPFGVHTVETRLYWRAAAPAR